ncbi:MAG TPA: glycosyltransferase [Bryobacteraceae bacterium]|nr:glycosyltransferase [Bryobacteraceae bacterium]
MSTVCAIVVTYNRKDRLRGCLDSLLCQTRPADRILVIDNAGTDGTRAMLDAEYPQVSKVTLKEYAGGAGGLVSGMRFAHCNKFDWIWTLDDSIEVRPECLETMLRFENEADLIQVQAGAAGVNPPGLTKVEWTKTETCDFRAALIGKKITELVGLPDERYFNAGYDTAYGYVASQKARSILLRYDGVSRSTSEEPARNRASFYLAVRNLFLNRDHLAKNGLGPRPHLFFMKAVSVLLGKLGEAAATQAHAAENALAVIDGLRDGIHKKFDRLPR